MEGAASTSGVKKSVVKRKLDSGEDIVAALDEELGYESDCSDASWFSDLEEDSDKEQSDCGIDVDESALQVEQLVTTNPSSRKTKAPPLVSTPNLSFEEPEKFTTSTEVPHEIPTGSQEIDYFSLFVNRDFCDFVAQETNRYADQNQQQKADPKWENTTGKEIQA